MTRESLIIEGSSLLGGVNESPEEANQSQVEIGVNVWAVNGKVETRPGYVGVRGAIFAVPTVTVLYARKEDNSTPGSPIYSSPNGAGVLDLSNLVKNQDRWYLGYSAPFQGALTVPTTNSNLTIAYMEYWNGTAWTAAQTVTAAASTGSPYHLSGSSVLIRPCLPQDWASTTVNGQAAYWLRFMPLCNNIDPTCTIDVDNAGTNRVTGLVSRFVGLVTVQFPSTSFSMAIQRAVLNNVPLTSAQKFDSSFSPLTITATTVANSSTDSWGTGSDVPATFAVVPQFEELYTAYNHRVYRQVGRSGTPGTATVSNDDLSIGERAPFDKRFVAMLGQFPRANFIMFFKGRLWAAGLEDAPFTVRWSGEQPHHRVWPTLSYNHLMEDDNSPITGLSALDEFPVIFKGDSIWIATPVDFDVNAHNGGYKFTRVVAGVGCVANGSIVKINGRLVFLADDGVYAFDGTPNIEKLTDRVAVSMGLISAPKKSRAIAINWRAWRVYLLAYSTGVAGDKNDTVFVWEYAADRMWFWTGVDAQVWARSEGAQDTERLFFGDSQNSIYEFGKGLTDHGGTITAHVRTQRFGYQSDFYRMCRQARVISDNHTRSLSLKLVTDDVEGSTATADLTSHVEPDWGALDWGVGDSESWTPYRRRPVREDLRTGGEWHQLDITHAVKGQRMSLSRVELGFTNQGRRK